MSLFISMFVTWAGAGGDRWKSNVRERERIHSDVSQGETRKYNFNNFELIKPSEKKRLKTTALGEKRKEKKTS